MKKRIPFVLIMVITIVSGSFVALGQSVCNQNSLKNKFTQLDAMPTYVKDSAAKYLVLPVNADKKVYITYKGDSIPSLSFEPVGETNKFFASGVFLEMIFLSTNNRKNFFYVKGKEIRELISGLPNLYFRVKIDREGKKILFDFYEKDGSSMYGEFYPESGQFCPEELLGQSQKTINPPKNKTVL